MESKKKKILKITSAVLIIAILVAVAIMSKFTSNKTSKVATEDNETRRAMTYNQITDADTDIDNCEYVKFSSFFIRDLDGDGYAEKYDGTCNYINKKATLYFDINVLTDGKLENGKITINGKNFDLHTTLIKDDVLKQDYIESDVTSLELNTINYGTQKLFYGNISADIGNNINNYSVTNNQIILTGTWVSTDGTKTVDINKVIPLKVDWYGKTSTSPYIYNTYTHNITEAIGNDEITLDFNVGYEETAEELLIQKQITEITIPELNGYAATSAIATSQNCTYNYDSETKKLTITREAVTNANGGLSKTVSRYNNYGIKVTYPIAAQDGIDVNTISITFPTTGYYYGYNNSSNEFEDENPYISSASRAFTHTWKQPSGSIAAVYIDVGRTVWNSDTNSSRQLISKKLPVNIYNNVEQETSEKDEYPVIWRASTGSTDISELKIEETNCDKFLKADGTYIDMTDYIKTTGIYFTNISNALKESGKLNIYKYDSNNQLIGDTAQTIEYSEAQNYTSVNPLRFNEEVKKVVIEAYDLNTNSYFYINQIKEIDDEKLTSDFTYDDFSNLNYIYSYVKSEIKLAAEGSSLSTLNTDQDYAYYEEPISAMKFTVTPYAITNQETKNIKMTLSTETSYYNEEKWKNGVFVIELPEEILSSEIKSVEIDNQNVEITSYETYEENGKQYIKIYTNNDTEETYQITIDTDVTADPRQPTITKAIKLYAINQNCHNYKSTSRTQDVLDINGNKNVSENVLYKTSSIQMIAPSSLLTSQTLSDFNDEGTEVVSPQIAILDKSNNSREAQINQTLTNNYSGTISEVKVIGKIPFKGNTYQINGKELGSTYSTTMKQGGITLPDSVQNIAKVYYSTNEIVNSTITDATNNWKTAEEVTDWSNIKTYLIDLSNYTIAMKESLTFSYKIEVPSNVKYNDVAYSTHAAEFCLDTEDGKLKSKTEVNRLGIMIAKKFGLSLTKYKSGTETKAQGATYKVTDGTTTRTGITDENGNISITNLFVDKEYTLKEIQTPSSYVLNEDEVKFKVTVDDEGNPQVNIVSGTLRDNATITNNDGVFTLNLNVEDIAKYDVKINKTNTQSEKLKGIKFRLTGGLYGQNGRIFTTNSDGEILISNLIPDTEYTLQETKADGYYVNQNPTTFKVSRNASNQLTITSDDDSFKNATISEETGIDKATITANIQNESIPKYTLVINKENKDGEKLAGTQFKLKSLDTEEETYYTTDENGTITIPNLYQYVDGKYITGEYILQEIVATEGYITDTTEIKFKAVQQDGKMNITILSGEDIVKSTEAGTDSITFKIENKEIFKLTKTGENDKLLPNAEFKITDLNGNPATDAKGNPIGELVGEAPVQLSFQTSQTYPWTLGTDGTWMSGGQQTDSITSTLTSDNFTISKSATLTFDWAVSSESVSYDYLYYTITNVNTGATIGGTSTKIGGYTSGDTYETLKFTTKTIELEAGTYNIVFTYKKDGSTSKGLDTGYVRNIKIAGSGYYALTTDENGEFTASLPEGLYKVIETKVPEGYELSENEEDRTYYVGIGTSRAQETEFTIKLAKSITGAGASNIYDVEPTDDGGYIAVGSFYGDIDINGDGTVDLTSEGSYDQLVVKYDGNSEVEWYKSFGGNQADELNSVSIATDGGYIVSGYEYKDSSMENAIIKKLDASGEKVWENEIGGSYEDKMKDALVLSNGNIVAIGRFASKTITINDQIITNNGKNNGFLVMYDSTGNYISSVTMTGTGDINPTSITETSQGFAISVDYTGSMAVQRGNTLTSAGNQDSAIIGFALDGGAPQWYSNIGGTNDESIVKLTTDSEDNVVAVGGFASSLTLGSETITAPTTSNSNSIMVKFSSIDGTYISSKIFGGTDNDDKISSVTPTEDGGLLLGAWYYSKGIDIDGDGTADITSVSGNNDSVIIKLSVDNEVEWYRTITGNSYDTVYAVAQLENTDLIVAGDFDSTSLSSGDKTGIMACQGYTDSFILRLGNQVTAPEIPEIQELTVKNELQQFKITTEIAENSDKERAGGTITGTESKDNIYFVENVKYGYTSTKQIVITPDEDYSIYSIEINEEKYEFRPDSNGVVTIPVFENVQNDYHIKVIFEKNLSSVTVHHYIKDKDGNYTTEQVAEDEYITGKIGSNYETEPKVDIDRYELEKDSTGNYVIPTNAKGTYTDTGKEIIYYYEEVPYTLTVHHYLDGTEEKLADDETSSIYYGEDYSTSANSEVLKKYELVENEVQVTPEGETSGKMLSNVEVTYYYTAKQYTITTETKAHNETDFAENIVEVKGGSISGEEETPYETVTINEDSQKDIIMTADTNYQIKSISIETTDDDGNKTTEQVQIAENTRTYTLDKFSKITGNKHVIVEYEKVKGIVTVHHYVEGTTTPVPLVDGTTANNETKTGNVEDSYATKARTDLAEGYELASEPDNASGTYIDGNIDVIYYYKTIPTSVVVHHYLEGTTTKLAEDVTFDGIVGDNYTTGVGNVDNKYELVAIPANANGKMTRDQIEVIYYYRLKDTSVLVHHYKEGTSESLSADVTINGKVDDEYTTTVATDIPSKYELVAEPDNKAGIMTVEQTVVTYYYRLKETGVDVHYYKEGTTEKVSEDVEITGKVDDAYTTTSATDVASKYELVETPTNATGTMTEDRITVIYYYRLKDTSVLVHHYLEGTTTSLSPDETINGQVDDTYRTVESTDLLFGKYDLVAEPDNKTGIMTEDQIVVTYYYRLKDTSVLVHHYIKDTTTSLSADVTINGQIDDEYTTTVASDIPEQYELVAEPDNKAGTMTKESIVVTYYYQLKNYPYVVNYLEKDTDKVLHEAKQGEELVYGSTVNSADEKIEIDGYKFDSFNQDVLTIGTSNNVINIYYTKRNDLSYKVNYLEKDTNNVLHEQKVQNGATFESEISSVDEMITINGYNFDSADKTTLIIGTGENVINIYYTKRTDLSYKVNYLEKTTNKELSTQKVVENMTFEDEITSANEKIEIDGYNYDSVDKETLRITTGENVINIYYTKRTDLSYKVNYLEKTTNKELSTQKVVENMTFEDEITSANEKIEIDGYNYDSVDKETLTIGTGENVINIYYTKRTDLSYTVNYLESVTNNVLHEPKVQTGMTFEDKVNAEDEVIDIDGYNYDYPDKYELVIGTDENVINIYYSKVTGLSYTVNYLEKGTDKTLFPSNKQGDMTFGDVINSSDEQITIDGYNYDSVDKDTLTIETDETKNVINIYYTKRTDLSYKVNYLEKTTNKELSTQKVVNGKTFEDEITSANEKIEIDGYNYDSVDKEILTIGTGENVINIYYTKRTDLSYKVNYLEKTTNKELSTQKVVNGKTFEDTVKSSDEKIDIDGYNYDSVDKETLTIGTGENVINIYYTKRTDLSYKVNYLEKTTNKELSTQKVVNGKTFEDTVKSSDEKIDIDGYNYDSVDKDALTIGTGENVINIYYTKRTDLSYKVNYLEKTTNKELSTQKVVNGKTFEDTVKSSDEKIDIDGYNYDSVDKETLKITTGENVINIYYTKRNDLSYKVNYLEKTTNKELSTQKVVNGKTFEETITSSDEVITIDGYNYDSVDKETLTITTGENVINIYYTKVTGLSYTVNYLEKGTDKVIHPAKTTGEQVFETEITSLDEVIDIDGYNYDSVDKDTLKITTGENIINIYYTKRYDLSYKVNYLEKITNKELSTQKIVNGKTFEDTVKSSDEVIKIDGYNYDSVDKETLTITTGENIINIYYTKRTDLSYKVNYLEKTTNKELSTQKVVNGKTFEDTVKSSDEKIDIDGYNYDSVDKDALTIGTGENVINIYYTKRTDLSYKVNYLEKTTNKELSTQKVVNGKTFEDTVKSSDEKIDIDGYNYDSVDKETLTIGTGENVINIYYTKRTDLSYKVNYLEKTTNKELSTQKVVNGKTFEETITSSDEVITIDGYNYDSVDKETLTIGTGENVINIYYTKRTDLSYKVNYLEKTTNKVLSAPKTVNGMTFEDEIASADEVISINGYKYDSVDKDTLIIGTGENVINVYYTKITGLSYTVNYLEKDTNIVINPAKTKDGVTFEDEINSSDEVIQIDGYNFNSFDKDTLTIGTGENVINIYYTKRTDLSYKVNYLEKDTNKVLHDQKVVENMTFEDEITSANEVIEIDGYNYDSVDKATLKITTGENVINIYYTKRNDLSYKVNYLEKDTNKELSTQKVVNGKTFEDEITSSDEVITIDGYNYDSVDKDTLTIGTGENVINIYYTKRTDLSYKVNYLEKTTNKELSTQKVVNGKTFEDTVKSSDEKIDIDGYNYDSVDKETLKITTGENIINIYYTKRTDLSYKVNYLEKDTNKVLHEQKIVENMTFEDGITSANEVISIDGYNYDSVDKDTLKITTGENVINIYYTKRNNLSYTVNYLEKNTNKVIHAPKVTGNMTFEDEITSADEIITINGYSYDSVDKDKLVITTGENTINIYYTKINGLAYTVNYLEKDTDKVIHAPKTTDNMTFEDEITSANEVIEIDGYNYDSVDKDTLVIGTGENIINIYYTKRNDLSYKVNYLEKGTNKVIHDQKVIENVTFEDEITSANEVIEIDGYNYDSVDKDMLKITTGENIINIYYTKRNDLSYKVNYLEKDTNKVIHDQKVVENVTFEDEITSANEVITIYGYNYDSVDKEVLKISTGENVINIYYTKKEAKVTVHYYEENSTNKVSEDKEITGKVNDEYTTAIADDIPSKYELVATPANATGTMTEDTIEVIYYFRKKTTQVIVRHYEEGTTIKLSEDVTIEGRIDDPYTTVAATDVPIKYELSVIPANAQGTMTEDTIEVIYYYRVKDAVLNIRYLEKNTNIELAQPEQQHGKVDEEYITGAKTIDGYTLVEHSGNERGRFEVNPLTVTYYYLYNTRATVQYIDKITGQILEQSTTEGLEGDDFVTESKSFDNYILVEEPVQKTVKMIKEEQVLKYYYIHVSGGVIEKHIDMISGEILSNDTHQGNEGDTYNIPSRTFQGYDLVEDRLPANAQGTMTVKPIEVIYYYIYKSKVTAQYVDKNTGEKLTEDEIQNGHEKDAYVTDRKTFDDYKLVEVPANADGEMTKEDITVTYNYVHTSGGVIVNHLDTNTGKQLLDETKQEGYEGDPYETHEENIPGYTLVKEKYPENAQGTMTREETKVTYYYVKNTEVNIKYIDKETGEEITEKTNIPGKEGDNYTTEPKDIPGYDLVEEPTNKDGTMTAESIDVIYYYRRPAKVVVKYIDQETNEEIATEEKQEGHQNDEYTTEAKDIKYYKLIAIPDNATGTMKVTVTKDENGKDIVEDTTYVTYYYRKLIFNLTINKKVSSVTVNGEESIINGDLGKVEIHRKEMSTAKVEVKYIIKVTNDSELTGKASILEDIPTGMTMNVDKNAGWEVKGTTATRETKELQPGESEEYIVVLDWENGENNIGMKENTASIISTENEAGFEEKDTTDNEDKADVIVAIGTGGHTYVLIAGGMLLILISLACGVYVIKKRK